MESQPRSSRSIIAIAASPFRGGGLLAALPADGGRTPCIHKGRYGLVTGLTLPDRPRLGREGSYSPDDWIWSPPDAGLVTDGGAFFFSSERSVDDGWEREPYDRGYLGEPVRLFERGGGQVRRIFRPSLLCAPAVSQELGRAAELRLQWELDQDTTLDLRMRGMLVVLGWLAQELAVESGDCEIGIHEPDLHYSVDRVSWRVS